MASGTTNDIYGSNAFVGISLWLMPKGQILSELQDIIETQSKVFNSPVFEPHVTLVAGLTRYNEESIIPHVEAIASQLNSFSVSITDISSQVMYTSITSYNFTVGSIL